MIFYVSRSLSSHSLSRTPVGSGSWTDVAGTHYHSVKGTKEDDFCANRGLCDPIDGTCSCFDTNNDVYGSSNGYGAPGTRGDCGYIISATTKVVSSCPGELACSGHGVCDTSSFRCFCSSGWMGGDCSEMVCPLGLSWFSLPTADNVAHKEVSMHLLVGLLVITFCWTM
jgi:hypothetical protein